MEKKKRGRKPNNKTHKLKALSEYLEDKCHTDFAKSIRIAPSYLSMLLSGERKASMFITNRIVLETKAEVTIEDLRPDIYEEVMKYAKEEMNENRERMARRD